MPRIHPLPNCLPALAGHSRTRGRQPPRGAVECKANRQNRSRDMQITVYATKDELAQAAAVQAAALLDEAIAQRGEATFVAATGNSQLAFLDELVRNPAVDWSRTTMFHLDEYLGLPATHPASFRLYLTRHLIERVHPGRTYLIEGDAPDVEAERRRLNQLLRNREVDVDTACRQQQVGEGWFASIEDVPRQAISMSIKQIMRARAIVAVVPERRKAQAVVDCFTGKVSPLHPASILRRHDRAYVFLDEESATLLPAQARSKEFVRFDPPNRVH